MNSIKINGLEIKYDGKQPRFWENVEAGKWEPSTFKVLDEFIKPGKIFIDIGSWNGVCSLYAAAKGAVCHAVEPDVIAIESLAENIKLNDAKITYHQQCISNTNGVLKLNTASDFGNSESSLVNRGNISSEIEIVSETLSVFFDRAGINPDDVCLIKIDIEGGEVFLLSEAAEFLYKNRMPIYISFHPAWFPNFEQDVKNIVKAIFRISDTGISRVIGMDGNTLTISQFEAAMKTPHEHSFILLPK